MTRLGLGHMDVDVHWAYHHKVRKLQRLYPERWPLYWCAYLVLLGEAWRTGERGATITESWCPALPCPADEATEALQAAGIVDRSGRIPKPSWMDWYGPVEARMEQFRQAGIASGVARKRTALERRSERRSNIASTDVQPYKARQDKTNQGRRPVPSRGRVESGTPSKFSDLVPPPPGYHATSEEDDK